MPDQTKLFQIECDVSKYASGAVLTQLDSNGDCHLVAFLSKKFSKTKHNYEIYNRELLALIRALEEWRHYIQGLGHITIIYSDHQNLTYFRSVQKLNRHQAWWSLYFSEFDVKLIHQPGSKMVQSDALSQQPDFILDRDMDNENMTLLPEHMFLNLLDITLQDRILSLGQVDDFLKTFSITDPPFGTTDKEETRCFIKDRIIFRMMWTCGRAFYGWCTIMRLLDILAKLRLWSLSSDIIGGLDCACLYKIM